MDRLGCAPRALIALAHTAIATTSCVALNCVGTDYYLGADMPEEDMQSLKIYLDDYPSSLLDELGLSPFLQTDRYNKTFVYADIVKTVPGLKNSGLLSQNRLIRHLATCGYHQTATPMLFRHATRDISFTLVVDDFGVKYTALSDYNHLKSSLELLYKVTSSPIGTRCLGFDIDYDRTVPCHAPLP